jgi:hypothetical protein
VTWADAPDGVTAPVQYGPRAAAVAAYLWHGQFLSRSRAGLAMADPFGCSPSPGAIASMIRRIAGAVAPSVAAARDALAAAPVAHIASRLGRAFRAAGSAACGSTDRDAEGLEKVLAGVSIRHEDVRGEGERQSSGLPVSRGA